MVVCSNTDLQFADDFASVEGDMRVVLWKKDTGARITVDRPDENWEDNEYLWTSGNLSCDCNRLQLMDLDGGCSEGEVLIRVFENGKMVYDEWENEQIL